MTNRRVGRVPLAFRQCKSQGTGKMPVAPRKLNVIDHKENIQRLSLVGRM